MNRLFILVALLLSVLSSRVLAAPVTVDLHDVKLRDVVRLVYAHVLPRSLVMDAAFTASEQVVSLSLLRLDPVAVERETRRLVEANGFAVSDAGGVVRVSKLAEDSEADDVLVYSPRFRSVSYLMDLCAGLFKRGQFAAQRSVAGQGVNISQVQGVAAAGAGAVPVVGQAAAAQSGVNAAANRDPDVLVYRGVVRDVSRLRGLLAQLDSPVGEVVVKAHVYEVRQTDGEGSAVNLALSLLSGKVGVSIVAGSSDQSALRIKANGLDALFSALSSDSRFKLVSSPVVRVQSGGSARFVAGADVPVLGNVSYQGSSGTPVQSVEYKTSGVILGLKPTVRVDTIDLEVSQQISSFVATTTGVSATPTLLKRQLDTRVTASDGEVIVIGGLDEVQDTAQHDGLSFLPSFLRASSGSRSRTEIMVVLDAKRI